MNRIALINFTQKSHRELAALLKGDRYQVFRASKPENLKESSGDDGLLVAIVDIDNKPEVKDLIQAVAKQIPSIRIFCLSERKLHPELEDLISRYVYACLKKPIETSELFYLLDCVKKDHRNNRGNES